jgi:hypothetical protein
MDVVRADGRGTVYHAFDQRAHAFTRTEEHPPERGRLLPQGMATRGRTLTATSRRGPCVGATADRGPE